MLPSRKSPRAKWIDYNEGTYFITVCTHEKIHSFGEIINGEMQLSSIGAFLHNELAHVNMHHKHIDVPLFVVMPNHFHALVTVNSHPDTNRRVSTIETRIDTRLTDQGSPLLSVYLGSLKAAVTRYAHSCNLNFKWQPRYHDHLIRSWDDCNMIIRYIEENVARWAYDCFY